MLLLQIDFHNYLQMTTFVKNAAYNVGYTIRVAEVQSGFSEAYLRSETEKL